MKRLWRWVTRFASLEARALICGPTVSGPLSGDACNDPKVPQTQARAASVGLIDPTMAVKELSFPPTPVALLSGVEKLQQQ